MRVLLIGSGEAAGQSSAKFLVQTRDLVCADQRIDPSRARAARNGSEPRAPAEPGGAETPPGDRRFVNAPAGRCSVRRGAFGQRFVRYRGGDYTVVGLYYVARPWRKPSPFFVLRRADGGDQAPAYVSNGQRRRLRRGSMRRAFAGAVTLAMLLALLWAWIGPELHQVVPPAAHGDPPSTVSGARNI